MAASALVGVTGAAWAQGPDTVIVNRGGASRLGIVSDKPYINPLPAPDTSQVKALTAATVMNATPGFIPGSDGAPPATGTRAFGTFGIPYSSGRVQALTGSYSSSVGANYLSTTTPYRRVGKLSFSAGYCSASVIRRGVIVTAAHCIQQFGSGANVFTGFTFRPGYYNGPGATLQQREPYGAWTWRAIWRSSAWANGTDTGSGSARNNDLALIALNKNAQGKFIGDVVGYFGYGWNNYSFVSSSKTGNLSVAETATLGYPALMDSGEILQRADGPSYLTTVGGALQIWQGNNFTGGSSGGPWVVNMYYTTPALSGGAVVGSAAGRSVVGVTSWGTSDPNAPKDNYSSRFGQNTQYPNASYGVYGAGNIGSGLNTLCSSAVSAGVTFAQAGYCD
jgi:hypothetical protein